MAQFMKIQINEQAQFMIIYERRLCICFVIYFVACTLMLFYIISYAVVCGIKKFRIINSKNSNFMKCAISSS